MEASNRADEFIPAGLAVLRNRGRRDRAGRDRRRPRECSGPRSSSLLALEGSTTSPPSAIPTSRSAAGEALSGFLDLSLRAQAAAIAAGEVGPRRAARRGTGADRGAQPGGERDRRDLPGAVAARCSPPRPRTAARRPDRDQGRVAAAVAGAALRRRRDVRPRPQPGESGPYRALRDAGADDRRRRQHARARRREHRQHLGLRPRPQPVGHRALPRRLLQRAGRGGRRPARRRGRGRRRRRLDPLSRPPTAGSPG